MTNAVQDEIHLVKNERGYAKRLYDGRMLFLAVSRDKGRHVTA